MSFRVFEYMKKDGGIRDIYTDPTKYPPQYFTAKFVQSSFLNTLFDPKDKDSRYSNSHVRVYDIVNDGWRTLRVWNIVGGGWTRRIPSH